MTWRCWIPFHSEPDGACGARGDDGPLPQLPGPLSLSLSLSLPLTLPLPLPLPLPYPSPGHAAPTTGTLPSLIRQCSAGGECRAAIGPFPFADGSLQLLSSDLMLAVTGAPR